MSIAKDVLQAEFSKHEGYAARIAHERHDRMGRLLAMGDRWLEDNEAQVRQEFPELFPVPGAELIKDQVETLKSNLRKEELQNVELRRKLRDSEADLSEAQREIGLQNMEIVGLRAQIDEIHAAKASDKPAGEDTLPPVTPVPDLPTA